VLFFNVKTNQCFNQWLQTDQTLQPTFSEDSPHLM